MNTGPRWPPFGNFYRAIARGEISQGEYFRIKSDLIDGEGKPA